MLFRSPANRDGEPEWQTHPFPIDEEEDIAGFWTYLTRQEAEGTVRINRALGAEATVYLRIPGNRQGAGKIQINLQNRTMEYLAVTLGDAIPTG